MTINKRVCITCDMPWCHNAVDFDHQYGPAARSELAENGWAQVDRKDFCPQHAVLGAGRARLTAVPAVKK